MLPLPDPGDTEFLERVLGVGHAQPSERRRFRREPIACRAEIMPLTLDGPDVMRSRSVTTADISRGGASIVSARPPLGPHWALALGLGEMRIVMEIAIRDLRRTPEGHFRVACQFVRRLPMAA
jgi:hypothetical protein